MIIYLNALYQIQMDKNIEKIISSIAATENLSEDSVKAALSLMTDWAKDKMSGLEYSAITWPNFGSFEILKGRIKDTTIESLAKGEGSSVGRKDI